MILCFLLPFCLGFLFSLGHPARRNLQALRNSSGFGHEHLIYDQHTSSTNRSPSHDNCPKTSISHQPTFSSPEPQTITTTGNILTSAKPDEISPTAPRTCDNATTSGKVPPTKPTFSQTENVQSTDANHPTGQSGPSTTYENTLPFTSTSSPINNESTTQSSSTEQTIMTYESTSSLTETTPSNGPPHIQTSTANHSTSTPDQSPPYDSFSSSTQSIPTNTNTSGIPKIYNETTSGKFPSTKPTFSQTENPQSTPGNPPTSPSDPSTTYESSSTSESTSNDSESTIESSPTDRTSSGMTYESIITSSITETTFSNMPPHLQTSIADRSTSIPGDSTVDVTFSTTQNVSTGSQSIINPQSTTNTDGYETIDDAQSSSAPPPSSETQATPCR